MPPLLSIERVGRLFGGGRRLIGRRPAIHAVREVDLTVSKGETVGIVGESGCGKTTLARLIAGLDAPTSGRIRFRGNDVTALAKKSAISLAPDIQYVFQDSMASLNPRKTVQNALEAPLIYLRGMEKTSRDERMRQLLEAVGLSSSYLSRYPHELSGGQAQRIGIARALAAEPALLVLDEPVSALDVSVQAQVLNILDTLKQRFALTYVFISHDLSVVESISDRVAVMYFGRIVEIGDSAPIFAAPQHPYTRLLLESAPTRALRIAEDADTELPDPVNPPPGCAFYARCPRRSARCAREQPAMTAASPGRDFACHHPLSEKQT